MTHTTGCSTADSRLNVDLLSLLGVIVAIGVVAFSQLFEGGQFTSLINLPALLIVVGGTLGAVMLQVSLPTFQRALRMLGWIFFPPTIHWKQNIQKLVTWSELARRDGILGLEQLISKETDPFMQKALGLLVDGRDPMVIRQVLEVEIDIREELELAAAKVYESMGGYTPTLGILGAVMGLIHVMENLSDPDNLGQGIATAFVATIYGVGLANLFLIPASRKLQTIIRQFSLEKEMIVEAMVMIAQGDNPHNVAAQLHAYGCHVNA